MLIQVAPIIYGKRPVRRQKKGKFVFRWVGGEGEWEN